MMNSFFEQERKDEANKFIKRFLSASSLWGNEYYMCNKTLPHPVPYHQGVGILYNRIKALLKNLVDTGEMSEETLKDCLRILVKEEKIISTKNVLSTKEYIEAGLYDDLLNIIGEEIELEQISDYVWEGLF